LKNDFPRIKSSPKFGRKMTEVAREFRKELTKSEAVFWQALRGKKLDGIKFRRQQLVGPFIVEFHNSVHRLVIEIDGSIHDSQFEEDKNRQSVLEELGLNVLRIKADLVGKDLSSALEMIRMKIKELQSRTNESSSPILGEGLGESE
jgi:very-short-patch-repair endonuclease